MESLEVVSPGDVRGKKSVVLDTSFLIYELGANPGAPIRFCKENIVLITDFNLSELKNVGKHNHKVKREAKNFFENNSLKMLSTGISPGDWRGERAYASSADPELLRHVHDPSDAVFVAAAINSRSDILARDKHHLFAAGLENKLNEHGIKVFNNISSYQEDI